MAQRIKQAAIRQLLIDRGHYASEFEGGDWDPGFRTAQAGTRAVHVFHDGPGEADHLDTYAADLREAGYHVHATQHASGRRRLEVTRP